MINISLPHYFDYTVLPKSELADLEPLNYGNIALFRNITNLGCVARMWKMHSGGILSMPVRVDFDFSVQSNITAQLGPNSENCTLCSSLSNLQKFQHISVRGSGKAAHLCPSCHFWVGTQRMKCRRALFRAYCAICSGTMPDIARAIFCTWLDLGAISNSMAA